MNPFVKLKGDELATQPFAITVDSEVGVDKGEKGETKTTASDSKLVGTMSQDRSASTALGTVPPIRFDAHPHLPSLPSPSYSFE